MGEVAGLHAGLATTVGAVPITDASDAVEFVLGHQPEFPTVPSPGSGPMSLLSQAVDGLAGVEVHPTGILRADAPSLLRGDGAIHADGAVEGPAFGQLEEFLRSLPAHIERTEGFVGVRIALVGPVSLTLALRSAGLPLEEAVAVSDTLVARRATGLLSAVRQVMPDHVAMVCINEPGLIGAMHPTFPLPPAAVLGLLDPVVCGLDAHDRAGDLLIGAHVPGRTDWETVIASGVSVVSAPAASGLVGWAPTLAGFLDRGGRVAWGSVPVDQPLCTSEELLWRRLSAVWCELVGEGLDPLVLRTRSLVSPVDGLGHFGQAQAALAVGLVESLSSRVRCQAVAARLSLGA
jgi:hypothetical protein